MGRTRTGAASLLPHSIGQSKSQGQPAGKAEGNEYHPLVGDTAQTHGNGEINGRHLWRPPFKATFS